MTTLSARTSSLTFMLQSNAGSALISTLLYLSFIATCIYSCIALLRDAKAREISVQHSELSRIDASTAAFEQISQQNIPAQTRLTCALGKARHGKIELSRNVCADLAKPNIQLLRQAQIVGSKLSKLYEFPYVDLDTLFMTAHSCPKTFSYAPLASTLNYPLDPASVVSSNTCRNPTGASTYAGNIEFSQAVSLGTPQAPQLFAGSGYIDFANSVQVRGPLLILAVGDLHIKLLESYFAVTLISMTGTVAVDSSVGSPHLKLIAWKSIKAPFLLNTSDNRLYPNTLSGHVLALSPVSN